jgi:hypothetical protein
MSRVKRVRLVGDRAIREYADAGFDEVYISQIGGNAEGFFDFYAAEVLPRPCGA